MEEAHNASSIYEAESAGSFESDSVEMSAEEMREACLRAAEQVGNFGDYKREELTTDYGQPKFDMMHAIIEAIRAIPKERK